MTARYFTEVCDDVRCLELTVQAGDPEPRADMSPREIVRYMLEVVEPNPNRRMRAASVRSYRRDLAARHREWYIDHDALPTAPDDPTFRRRRAAAELRRMIEQAEAEEDWRPGKRD